MDFEVYFDETGDDGGFPIVALAGYVVQPDRARLLEQEWSAVLLETGLPYFHMVDCAHGNEFFSQWAKEDRINLQKRLFKIIDNYVEIFFIASAPTEHFSHDPKLGNPYPFCLDKCLLLMSSYLDTRLKEWQAKVYYENGHKHSSEAVRLFEKNREEYPKLILFKSTEKKTTGMIQAADILAWQFSKHVKRSVAKQGMRADFAFLMRKPGMICHVFPRANDIVIAFQYNDGLTDPFEQTKLQKLYSSKKNLEDYLSKQDVRVFPA